MAKVFSKAIMASEDIQSYVGSCVFQANSVNAPITDGAFVKLGNLKADTTYVATGDVDYNVYLATAPAAVTDKAVVIDIAEISEGSIAGNSYKMGIKLFDLTAPAGRPVRFRRLAVGDKFWLGGGNFAAAPTVGNIAGLTANDVILTDSGAATITAGQLNIKVLVAKDFNYGQSANGKLYLCEVVAL